MYRSPEVVRAVCGVTRGAPCCLRVRCGRSWPLTSVRTGASTRYSPSCPPSCRVRDVTVRVSRAIQSNNHVMFCPSSPLHLLVCRRLRVLDVVVGLVVGRPLPGHVSHPAGIGRVGGLASLPPSPERHGCAEALYVRSFRGPGTLFQVTSQCVPAVYLIPGVFPDGVHAGRGLLVVPLSLYRVPHPGRGSRRVRLVGFQVTFTVYGLLSTVYCVLLPVIDHYNTQLLHSNVHD